MPHGQPFVPCTTLRLPTTSISIASADAETDPKLKKRLETATKRIDELDELVEEADAKIAKIDAKMLLIGDEDELFDLQKDKERIEKQIAKYLKEWDDLEELLEGFSST